VEGVISHIYQSDLHAPTLVVDFLLKFLIIGAAGTGKYVFFALLGLEVSTAFNNENKLN
jgi:hypothetical protein